MLNVIVLENNKSAKKKYSPGTIVPLNRGYARYLINKGNVLSATEKNQVISKKILEEKAKKKNEKIKNAQIVKDKLEKEEIFFVCNRYNGNGTLFGAIKVQDVVNYLHKLSPLYKDIKSHDVLINIPVKIHGFYVVTVYLYEINVKIPMFVGKSEVDVETIKKQYLESLNPETKEEETDESQ